MKKKRFLVVGVIALAAFIYVIVIAIQHATTNYYDVSKLLDQSTAVTGDVVRVRGMLATAAQGTGTGDSSGNSRWQFVLSESGKNLTVVYQGVLPDAFKVGNELIVEGKLDPAGVFQGQTIITKCPSKYEPATQ